MTETEQAIYDQIQEAENACSDWCLGIITSHRVAEKLEQVAAKLRTMPCDEIIEQN